jgi:CheY-like chemotaxis protein
MLVERSTPKPPATPPKPRVLVVEDDADGRLLMQRTLTLLGYEPLLAEDGQEGVATARRERPAVILMDLQLPILDGFEATKAIRAEPGFERVPIVAVSALDPKNIGAQLAEAGFDGFLRKPISLEVLRDELARRAPQPGRPQT